MELHPVARRILNITAIAWGIPLALADHSQVPETVQRKVSQQDVKRDDFVRRPRSRKSRATRSSPGLQATQVAAAASAVTDVNDGLANL